MSIEGRFNDLGIDPVIAVKLMDLLNVSSDDFIDARRFERFKDVASYIGRFENYEYMIRKLTLTKNVDRLDHMWEWCQLSKQRQDIEKSIEDISFEGEELDKLSSSSEGVEKLKQIQKVLSNKVSEINNLDQEMELYG